MKQVYLSNSIFFGLTEEAWLIIALAFLGFSAISFFWVWWGGFIRDKQSGKQNQYPWQ